MKKFFSFIIRQSVAIILIVCLVLGFGVYSTINMPINLLPDINVPMVCVQVIYPGANAQSVEKDVTGELEEGLSSISGVTGVDSYSYDNLSALVLSFDYGTDTNQKKADINSKLSTLKLPDGIDTRVYDIDLNAEALAKFSVTGDVSADDNGLAQAFAAAEELTKKLQAIDGVESVEIKGGPDTDYVIRPFGGLELISPLIVQAFSYGALDIPIGNITEESGGIKVNVQIRNNSDVQAEEDIDNMPITLPAPIVTLLSSVKRLCGYYQDSTEEDLRDLRSDLSDGVLTVLRDIDNLSSEELNDFATLKTYMNISATYSAEQLQSFKKSRYYNEIYKQVTNDPEEEGGERTPKTDDELEELVDDIKDSNPAISQYVTVDMLKVVRDGKLDNIMGFRSEYVENDKVNTDYNADEYYELTEDDYFVLETLYVKVYAGSLYEDGEQLTAIKATLSKENEENDAAYVYPQKATLLSDIAAQIGDGKKQKLYNNIDFARKTSATGLAAISDKKEDEGDDYVPTNSECALLFTGTTLSEEHPIVTSPTFMAFVRADSYNTNMRRLINHRRKFGEGDITAAQFYLLYSRLDLEGIFEFTLSEELFGFVLGKESSDLAGDSLVVSCGEISTKEKKPTFSSYVYYTNGSVELVNGTIIEIYKSNGANSSAVVQRAKEVYQQYLKETGSAVQITLLDDQSEFISDSISNVLVSILIGGVLAVLVIFLFLKDWRTSLIIAVTMPLSVLAALICLSLMGITLNMVSLGGLAVGIGMLVDNSIVVIESVTKHRDKGKSAFEAAVDGTCEVGGALIGSTLTTVCVFIPIIFSGGLTGEIFTDLSWAVIFSLTFSLLVAVTVIPTLYALFGGGKRKILKGERVKDGGNYIPPPEEEQKEAQPLSSADNESVEIPAEEKPLSKDKKPSFKERVAALKQPRVMNGITSFYGKVLPKVLNKKLITLIVAVAVFGASVGMLFITGTEFLPSIDKGQFEVNMTYASGVELDDIQENVSGFANVIEREIENIDYVSVSVGKNGLLALTDTGIITVQLKTSRGTDKVVNRVRALAEEYKGGICTGASVREIDGVVASLMSGADDMSVTVMGDDVNTLKEIADKIKLRLEEDGFKDAKTSASDSVKQYTLHFDRRKMAELGLDYQTTVLTLRIGIASYTACTVTIDDTSYGVCVQFNEDTITSLATLEDFVVGAETDDGTKAVKLKDILIENEDGSKILVEEQEACIRRQDGKRMISVSATLPGVDTGAASARMKKVASGVLKEYDGYKFEESGITDYLNDAFAGLVVALIISFVLLYGVMAVQFASALKPLIVMSSIPFSFTGGFLALVITGTRLNVVSFIGLIMLMGVVVNNAIVMLEKIKQLHDSGMQHYAAVQEACKVRLRPIFMTTLTTILALIPLAIGLGKGSELMQPLGIVVMGGLLLGTLVTLVLIPTVYCAVYGISAKRPDGRKKKALPDKVDGDCGIEEIVGEQVEENC